MAVENVVRMIFRLLLEGKNVPKEAAESVDGLDKAQKRVKKSTDDASQSFDAFGKKLAGVVTAGAVLAYLRSASAASAELERRWAGVTRQLDAMGLSGERLTPRIRASLEAMQLAGDGLQSETIPAFQKLLGLTGDVSAALYGTKLAADLSDAGFGSVAEGADLLGQILQGRVLGAATRLNVAIRDQNGNLRDSREVLQEVIQRWEGYSQQVDDSTARIDRWKGTWARISQGIGDQVNTVLNWLDRLVEKSNEVGDSFWAFLGDDESARSIVQRRLGEAANAAEGRNKLLARAELARKEAEAKNQQETDLSVMQSRLRMVEQGSRDELYLRIRIWQEQKAAALANAGETGKTVAQIDEQFAAELAAIRSEWEQRATKDLQQETDRRIAEAQREADERARAGQAALDARARAFERERDEQVRGQADLDAKARAFEEAKAERERQIVIRTADEMLELQLQQLDEQANALLGVNVEKWQKLHEVRTQLLLEQLDREEQAELAGVEKGSAAYDAILQKYRLKRSILEKRSAAEGVKVTTDAEKQKTVAALQATQQIVGAMQTLFAKNKTLAIATATIDTIVGAQAAFAQTPGPIWVKAAAAVAAALMGLARIAAIKDTQLEGSGSSASSAGSGAQATSGRGYDDPVNDQAAYTGSQRWGRDFTREMLAGVSQGMAAGARDSGSDPTGGRRSSLAETIARAIAPPQARGSGRLAAVLAPAGGGGASSGAGGAADSGPLELGRESTRQLVEGIGEQLRDALREEGGRRGDAGSGDTVVVAGLNYLKEEGLRQLNRDLERVRRRDSNRKVG